MDSYIEPRQIINTLLRWWWVLVLGTLISVAIGYGLSQRQTPVYEATTTLMVGEFIQTPQINRDDIVARDAYTQAYAEMALRKPVLNGVVKALGLDIPWKQLGDVVSIYVVENTPLIEINAKANSPQTAQAIAGEIANQLILLRQPQEDESSNRQFVQQEVESVQLRIEKGRQRLAALQTQASSTISPERLSELEFEIDTLQRFVTDWEDTYARLLPMLESNVPQNSLTVIEEAQANPSPVSPHLTLNLLLSACLGFGLALGQIFLINQFDDRIRTGKVLEQQLGLTHLGTIIKMKGRNYDGKLIAAQNPLFGTALFYRKILKKIGFIEKANQSVKSLLITSPRLREGKSITVSNLGIVTAQAGFKTIIVDVDWKKPVQHRLFDVSNEIGLMDLLTNTDLVTKEQLQATGVPNLQILTVGNLPGNPVEMLTPKRMKQILSDLTRISNVIILDAPSTTIKEGEILYGLVDGVILVIDSNRTTTTSVKQAMTSLYLTGGKVVGGILNKAPSYMSAS